MNLWPQSLKVYKHNSLFIKVLLFFTILAIACTLVVGYGTYLFSTKMLIEEVQSSNFHLLKQAQEAIDKEIGLLNKIALQVANDRRIYKGIFMGTAKSPENIQLSMDIIKYLNSLKAAYSDSVELWLYFKKSQIVLSQEGRFSIDFFLKEMCRYQRKIEWPELFNSYTAFQPIGREIVTRGVNQVLVITFIRSMPLMESLPMGMMVFNVDEGFFGRIIQNVSGDNPVITYVVDSKGKIVFGNETQQVLDGEDSGILRQALKDLRKKFNGQGSIRQIINGKKYTISYIASGTNDWYYLSLIPTRFITRKAGYIGYLTLLVVLFCLIFGVALSFYLTRKIYNPIYDILSSLNVLADQQIGDAQKSSKDELKFINKIISYLMSEKENWRDVFNKSLPMLKEKFLIDILEGNVSGSELRDIGWRLEMDFHYELFQVVMVESDDPLEAKSVESPMELSAILKDILEGSAPLSFNIHSIRKGSDHLILIANLSRQSQESGALYDLLQRFSISFYREHKQTLSFGVGNIYQNVADCSKSFGESSIALRYKISKGQNSIIHYDEVRNTPQCIFNFPLETEKRMINLLKAGELPSIMAILEEIVASNLNGKENSPEMIANLFNALVGMVNRTIYDLHFTPEEVFGPEYNIYEDLNQCKSVSEKQKRMIDLFTKTITFIQNKKGAHHQKIYERTREYIVANYQRDLSLENVSQAVGLSSSYLSWIFKEVSGVNFIDFLNKFRIEKAKDILLANEKQISEVAQELGYQNSNTFIKVFKKYEGITPGQFRENR